MAPGSPPRTGVWIFPDRPAGELVGAARLVESLGLDELWLGDEGPAREPLAILAAAAGVTDRITLATGVTNPYVRHPVITAAAALTVHELSGGRALLGVGAGGDLSLAPMGLNAHRPVQAVTEMIDLVRAVADGRETEGYAPPEHALAAADVGSDLPVYVGARGERLNRLASVRADGAFVAGMPPFRFDEVISWARSARPIDIALYPSAAMSVADVERHRPEMIWSLRNAPPEVRSELGIDPDRVAAAADALREGDQGPARALVDDEVLDRLMLVGSPAAVGARLAELVRRLRPASIGLALMPSDLEVGIEAAAEALTVMRDTLAAEEGPP